MRHGSRRAKGRRLQVTVAEALSEMFKLTIEAVKPTPAGTRKNGAVYVDESFHTPPDLRVRRSGEAGSDVALLSQAAQTLVAWKGKPWWIECKNAESWHLDAAMWGSNKVPALVLTAFEQIRADKRSDNWRPLVVLGKNRHPAIAVIDCISANIPYSIVSPYLLVNEYVFLPFDLLVTNFMGRK